MTSKECTQYMRSTECYGTTIYDKWLKPTNEINQGTIYEGRCVGNSPELMPLDNSLNRDLQLSHTYHCAVTAHLPDNDNRKFSLSTPLRIARGIKKIWEDPIGAPNSKRVIEDVYLAFEAHRIIYEANGKMVPGLANRNGHRNRKEGNLKWGGKRVKSFEAEEETWLEAGAKTVIEDKKILTKSKYLELFTGQ